MRGRRVPAHSEHCIAYHTYHMLRLPMKVPQHITAAATTYGHDSQSKQACLDSYKQHAMLTATNTEASRPISEASIMTPPTRLPASSVSFITIGSLACRLLLHDVVFT